MAQNNDKPGQDGNEGPIKEGVAEPNAKAWITAESIQQQLKLSEFVKALNSPEGLTQEQKQWWRHRY